MLHHIKPGMLIFSVLYILLGLLLLLSPQSIAMFFCVALGILVILCGLQNLYEYFNTDNSSLRAFVSLLLSAPTIALGVWALLVAVEDVMAFESLLPLLFGLMLLIDGIVRAQSSLALAKRKGQKWWVMLLLSFVSLLCGALLMFSEVLNHRNVDLLFLSGIFLLAEGILNLCCTIYTAMEFHALDRLDAVSNAKADAGDSESHSGKHLCDLPRSDQNPPSPYESDTDDVVQADEAASESTDTADSVD